TAINLWKNPEIGKISTLNTIFTGVTAVNFNNFIVDSNTFTLTAKDGFIFGESNILKANVVPTELNLIATPTNQIDIDQAVDRALRLGYWEWDRLTMFNGITSENFKNFDVIGVGAIPNIGQKGTITLRAHEGYVFPGNSTQLISIAK
ncbi:MAG: hypothetical protein KFW07_00065, partial [Mycoplasmataceae bacterium]|nr:hypothetical protein [Mycoplasmataceae bacterium]